MFRIAVRSHGCIVVTRVATVTGLSLLLLASPPSRAQTVRESLWSTNGRVNAMSVAGDSLYVGGEFGEVGPATGCAGIVDSVTAKPPMPFPIIIGEVACAVADGAGGWFVGGQFSSVGG